MSMKDIQAAHGSSAENPGEQHLDRAAVAQALASIGEMCESSRIGYYPSVTSLAERVAGTRNWEEGEVFVYAHSPTRYLILKQIAPDSCEMLTVSHSGYHDVLTAYRFPVPDLVQALEDYMQLDASTL